MSLAYFSQCLEQIATLDRESESDATLKGNDGSLVIFSEGLGVENVIASFLNACSSTQSLVFLLHATASQTLYYYERWRDQFAYLELVEEKDKDVVSHRFETSLMNETSMIDRPALYRKGGLIAISSQMLIVDLLQGKIPLWMITGFVLLDAHAIKENSLEAFVLSLYRKENTDGFVRAFSTRPEFFTHGFNRFYKCMSYLHCTRAYFWPR
jgi:DNA excision repair protein ERCC-4